MSLRRLGHLIRKELLVLFGSPVAYLTLALISLITSLLFFDLLRDYNQVLFLYTSNTMRGFELGTIPAYINIRDQVFLPLMSQLGGALIAIIPLITMRVFAEEKTQGTQEFLLTTELSDAEIVLGKFAATFLFVALLIGVSFVYPASAIVRSGLGPGHLISVYIGLLMLAFGLAAIGLTCSALAANQLVAAVAAYAVAFTFYDFSWANAFVNEFTASLLSAISLLPRFTSFAEGLVSFADVAFFAGVTVLSMAIARLSLDLLRIR